MGNFHINKLQTKQYRTVYSSNYVKRNPDYFNKESQTRFVPDNHFLYYHISGERIFIKDNHKYVIRPGDIALFHANKYYRNIIPVEPYSAINISFQIKSSDSHQFIENKIKSSIDYLAIPFITHAKDDIEIYSLFEEISKFHYAYHPLSKLRKSNLLDQLLLILASRYELMQNKQKKPIDKVIEQIRSNPSKNFTIDELANSLHVSRSTLTKSFKKATNKSIKEYTHNIKIQMAKNLIELDQYISFDEISSQLGFHDAYHFSKVFKKVSGVSPSTYRKHKFI